MVWENLKTGPIVDQSRQEQRLALRSFEGRVARGCVVSEVVGG